MSLLSNPNPVRLGKFQSWLSPWYENNLIYSSLIYTDLYVNEFLNGIYYKLKVPTSTPIIRELGYQQLMISLKSYISLNKKNMHIINNYKYLNHFKYKHRKIFFYFRRILRNLKKNNFYIFKKNKVKTKGRNVFYLFPSIFLNKNEGIKKTVNISNSTYKINKNNKLKYLSVINQLYYNLFNKKKIKKNKLKKNILLFIRKNKLKNIWNSLIAENKILIKKLKNKNFDKNIKVKNSFSILKNINFRKKK